MKLKRPILFIFLAFLFLSNRSSAQNCLENLYKAQKLLDAGNTDACLTIAIPCSQKLTK